MHPCAAAASRPPLACEGWRGEGHKYGVGKGCAGVQAGHNLLGLRVGQQLHGKRRARGRGRGCAECHWRGHTKRAATFGPRPGPAGLATRAAALPDLRLAVGVHGEARQQTAAGSLRRHVGSQRQPPPDASEQQQRGMRACWGGGRWQAAAAGAAGSWLGFRVRRGCDANKWPQGQNQGAESSSPPGPPHPSEFCRCAGPRAAAWRCYAGTWHQAHASGS